MVSALSDYDFWLFDLDGTLVDVDPAYARAVFDDVGDRLGTTFTDSEVTLVWHGLDESRDRVLRRKGVDVDRFWTAFHAVEDPVARAEATFLYDDAAFVADLPEPVGIVTHCQRYLTDVVIDQLDIRDWFDAVVCCDDDLGWKPDPTPVYHALADLGVTEGSPAATDGGVDVRTRGVLAGDQPTDIGAAWNVGIDGIHVERHGHDLRGQCVLGDYRIESFEELDV